MAVLKKSEVTEVHAELKEVVKKIKQFKERILKTELQVF